MSPNEDGFNELRVYILETLKRIETKVDDLTKTQAKQNESIVTLKTFATIFGAIAGIAGGALVSFFVSLLG